MTRALADWRIWVASSGTVVAFGVAAIASYLESVRAYAGPDGQLSATLDWLVWDTFGEVLERRDQQ